MKPTIFGKSLLNIANYQIPSILPSVIRRFQYTSVYSLKNLYPESSCEITTPPESKINEVATEKFSGYIPLDKVKFTYLKSPGPGGQHAHATLTKVVLRVNLENAEWLQEDVKKRLLEIKKNKLTKEGDLLIRSDKTRSQQLNKADVLQRLRTIIYNAIDDTPKEPSPETVEMIRKRQEKANRERLRVKRLRSLKLDMRRNFE